MRCEALKRRIIVNRDRYAVVGQGNQNVKTLIRKRKQKKKKVKLSL
jgi:hypothetical protein